MKEIIIIGAGELGREVVWLLEDINRCRQEYLILGFLDDDAAKKGKKFCGYPVIGTTDMLEEIGTGPQTTAVIAVQDGSIRRRVAENHSDFCSWETVIHPAAVVAPTSCIGRGSIVFPHVTVSACSSLGMFGLYYIHATVCNDCTIGDHVSVMTGAVISEHVSIGAESYLSAGCFVYPHRVLGQRVRASAGAAVEKNCGDGAKINGRNGVFSLFK